MKIDFATSIYLEHEPGYFTALFDIQLDTQYRLLSLTLVYISEQSSLLPRANLHIPLEQITRDDEVLDIILQQEAT